MNCLKAKFKLKHHTASDKAGVKPWNKTSRPGSYLLTVVHLQRLGRALCHFLGYDQVSKFVNQQPLALIY